MDWRIVTATFALVFIAELGDKTRLMVFARWAGTGKPVAVFAGDPAIPALTTFIGVLAGGAASKLPDRPVRCIANADKHHAETLAARIHEICDLTETGR